jgi:hypothetical protein
MNPPHPELTNAILIRINERRSDGHRRKKKPAENCRPEFREETSKKDSK